MPDTRQQAVDVMHSVVRCDSRSDGAFIPQTKVTRGFNRVETSRRRVDVVLGKVGVCLPAAYTMDAEEMGRSLRARVAVPAVRVKSTRRKG